jgi:hypothetical protein
LTEYRRERRPVLRIPKDRQNADRRTCARPAAGRSVCAAFGPGAQAMPRAAVSARVAEQADALDLGSSEETRGGSNPPSRTLVKDRRPRWPG